MLIFIACNNPATEVLPTIPKSQLKTTSAISCTNDMLPEDSSLYIHGGATAFEPTIPDSSFAGGNIPKGMVFIPGGIFSMGAPDPVGISNGGKETMKDCRPIHRVKLNAFYMDEHEVTNADFAAFVKAIGYITIAEQKPTAAEFPGAKPEDLLAGSVVFTAPSTEVPLKNHFEWWSYIPQTNWRHPLGPKSDIKNKENDPVVHIAWEDAVAYAKWAGKRLPTEAEWEYAGRGGLTGNMYAWGNRFRPDGKFMANSFQGHFPNADSQEDGFGGIAPIKKFPPNSYGLYDMAGNVWEWCADWYRPDYFEKLNQAGVALNPSGPSDSFDPSEPGIAKKVQRGGSFLCTDQYCTRYMMGTRGKGDWRTGTNHLGFRCVKDVK